MELILPGMSELEVMIFMNQLRRHMANSDVFIADRRLYIDMDAKIVECNAAWALKKIWPLCSQALFLDNGKRLILTEASEDTWQASLDKMLTEHFENVITRIRWKPPRNGGRHWLTPSAISLQLGASRRKKGIQNAKFLGQFYTEVSINPELGPDERDSGSSSATSPRIARSR